MKSNRGMTIVALIIYVIVLSIVIGTISLLMKYFYKNTDEVNISANASDQYSRFLSYITDDINSGKIDKENTTASINEINFVLLDQTTKKYKYEDGKIYYIIPKQANLQEKYIELCSGVSGCTFTYIEGKINTTIIIGERTYRNNFSLK